MHQCLFLVSACSFIMVPGSCQMPTGLYFKKLEWCTLSSRVFPSFLKPFSYVWSETAQSCCVLLLAVLLKKKKKKGALEWTCQCSSLSLCKTLSKTCLSNPCGSLASPSKLQGLNGREEAWRSTLRVGGRAVRLLISSFVYWGNKHWENYSWSFLPFLLTPSPPKWAFPQKVAEDTLATDLKKPKQFLELFKGLSLWVTPACSVLSSSLYLVLPTPQHAVHDTQVLHNSSGRGGRDNVWLKSL